MQEIDKLFGRLEFRQPVLKEAKRLYENRLPEEAMAMAARHFATRKSPAYLFEREEVLKCRDPQVLEDAGRVMRHDIFGHRFPGDIDWDYNPTKDTSRDNEWSWSLFRNIYWQPLARAYVLTGDEKYTREFVAQMKSFSRRWPVEPFMGDDLAQNRFPGHAWRTIEAGIRIYTTWLPCFECFRKSPAWDAESWAVFLNMIYDHAEFLMMHYSNHNRSSNWLSMEASALLQCGILFPELKRSPEWLRTGYRRVMHETAYCFDNDGVHMERTPVYHLVASIACLPAWRLCVKHHIPVPPYALPILEKSAEFLMRLVKPDFTTPMIGDADRESLTDRRSDTSVYEGMNLTFDPADLNELRAYFRTMYEITGRPDFLYFATGRRRGKAPSARNYKMAQAGIYVMRTGWGTDDSYCLMHGVQLERGERSTHSHNDQCHWELSVRGEDILIDSGRYIYNSSCWKNWRHYFTGACAHNTLYVDDHEMGAVPGVSRVRGVRTYCHHFEENDRYGLIDLSHNGYADMDDPVFHRRRVVRLPGDIYILDDRLTGPGKQEHDMRLFFHFAPGRLVKMGENCYAYYTTRETKYRIFGFSTGKYLCGMLNGSEDPIGGWISFGYANRQPAPQLWTKADAAVPLRWVHVIAPDGISCSGSVHMEGAELILEGKGRQVVRLEDDSIQIQKG